jgi:hypothetical protein
MKLFLLAIIIFQTSALWAQVSYVPPTKLLKKKGVELRFGGDFWRSKSNVDEKGNVTKLPGDQGFTRYQGEFSGLYGATNDLQFGLGARLRANESTYFDSANEEINARGMGLQSIFTSAQFAFPSVGNLQYTLEGLFRYTPYTNEVNSVGNEDKLILGDDGNEYSLGLGVTYSSKTNNHMTFRGGYRQPGNDISSEIYWQLEAAMAWSHFAFVAGVDGVSSLSNDPFENDLANRPNYNTGNTFLYHAVNREWIAPYAGVNVALGYLWRIELRASHVVVGKSTDLGTSFGIHLIRRADKADTRTVDSRFKTYDIEGSVTKVSPKKEYVVIDRGLTDDVQKGMTIDLFEFDYVGGNILVARGTVVQAKSDSAIVKITQRFNDKREIKEGLIARASLR